MCFVIGETDKAKFVLILSLLLHQSLWLLSDLIWILSVAPFHVCAHAWIENSMPRRPGLTSALPGVENLGLKIRLLSPGQGLCRLYKMYLQKAKTEASHYCSSQHFHCIIPLYYFHSKVLATFAWNSTLSAIYIPGTVLPPLEIHVAQDIKNKYYVRKCKDFHDLVANHGHLRLCMVWVIDYTCL